MTDELSLSRTRRDPAKILAVFLFGAGTMHFLTPKPFDAMIPPALPGSPRTYTQVSGAAEIAVAGLLIAPGTRRLGGRLAALLFLVVWPGNFQMAYDWGRSAKPLPVKIGVFARLPMQLPMIAAARRVYRHGR
ncbi:DoxX family protein [Nocardia jejuensis]|uniref:DoxX family protein n=1 Tax=Nocardia jejuensis TaxID=328049 RepID=UPI0008313755|nr:hypothetical protein [Nocardia jejuensis]